MRKLQTFVWLFIAAGAAALVSAGADTIVFGPQTYSRAAGKPVAVRKTFRVTRPSGNYTLRVTNHGVTSADISLNGRTVLDADDFTVKRGRDGDHDRDDRDRDDRGRDSDKDRDGKDDDKKNDRDHDDDGVAVASLTRSVTLRDGNNEVIVELSSKPGTSLVLEIFKAGGAADTTPPAISVVQSPPPNANGWNNTNVTVTFTCADAGSGVASCPAPVVVTTEGANQVIAGTARDSAGNTASASITLKIDKTPPIVTATPAPLPNASGWNGGPVIVTFGATDTLSGVAPGSVTAPVTLATDGSNQSATGQARDLAGNVGTVTRSGINIDQTKPGVTVTLSPPPNANGWNNGPVSAHFVCADPASGIAVCPADRIVTAEGAGQTITGTARDRAGNEAAASATVSIDTTPPAFSWLSPQNGTTLLASVVTATGTVSDELSGVATLTCNGSPVTPNGTGVNCGVTLVAGQNVVTAIATDAAGNTRTSTLSLVYTRGPVVRITSPPNQSYLSISPTTVTGTVDDPLSTVTVNSIEAPVVNGAFSIPLPLAEGPNIITASAAVAGAVGTDSLTVTLDTTQPHVTITSPPDKFITTEASISVAGAINDLVVGTVNDQQAQVTVNGAAAQVANRTFLATEVQLSVGPNVIQAIGRDRVGNAATTEITVTRQTPARAQIHAISGNNQTGSIASMLQSPLVVALTDAAGNPVPNKPVIFKVTQNDGLIASAAAPAPTVIATTDAQGQAQARWTLGRRAGAGGNAVEAYAVGFDGTALFSATGTAGPAGIIVVDAGNDQIGAISQPLARPFIAVVVDAGNNRLGGVPVTFAVTQGGGSFAGEPSVAVATDSDGRASATLTLGVDEGNANNVVEADFPADTGLPASFSASARVPGDPAHTTVSGVVLDNSNKPIPGVTVRAVLTSALRSSLASVQAAPAVLTNAQGQFSVPQAPVGLVKVLVDGTTAQLPGTYPSLEYDLVTVSGRDNTVGQPIYLLPLTTANELCVTPATGGGTLTIPEAPGFSLTFGPGQVTFPGGSKTGCISVTVVHGDKVPMVPAFGQQPQFIVTIQPPGAIFSPPAPLTLPNVDGLKPREVTEMYSFDHDIGSFVAIGTGTVSNDGQIVRSDPGVGVLKAGWHSGGPPKKDGSVASVHVSINGANPLNIDLGRIPTVTASGRPNGGTYSWSSDDPAIAELQGTSSGSGVRSVLVKGKAVGTTTLRVRYRKGEAEASAAVTVKVREVARVVMTPRSPMNLTVDGLGTVTATATPSPGTYTWSSGDPTVAEIQGTATGANVTSVSVKGIAVGRTSVRVHYESQSGATADASITVSVNVIGAPALGDFVLGQDPPIPYSVPSGTTFDSMRLEVRNFIGTLVFEKDGLPTSAGLHETRWEALKWNQTPHSGSFANPNNGPYDVNIIGVKNGVETNITRSVDVRLVIEADLKDPTPSGPTTVRPTRTAGLAGVLDTLKVAMKLGATETEVSGPDIRLTGSASDSKHLTVNADAFNILEDGVYTVTFKDLRDDIGNPADSDGDPSNEVRPYQFLVDLR